MKLNRRLELIVSLKSLSRVKSLKKYGSLKYFSRSMRYAIVYVNAKRHRKIESRIRHLRFVANVQESPLAGLAKRLVEKTVAASDPGSHEES